MAARINRRILAKNAGVLAGATLAGRLSPVLAQVVTPEIATPEVGAEES